MKDDPDLKNSLEECQNLIRTKIVYIFGEETVTLEGDLLILDIMLPLVNGYECMKAIREKKNIPIIIVSAKSTDEDKIIEIGRAHV